MNLWDILLLGLLTLAVTAAVIRLRRGGSGCCDRCKKCSRCEKHPPKDCEHIKEHLTDR